MKKRNIVVGISVVVITMLFAGCRPVDPHDMTIDPAQTYCVITEAPEEEIME